LATRPASCNSHVVIQGFKNPMPQVAFTSAAISAYAWTVRAFGKCMDMSIPLSLINFSLGSRRC
jgi:hypothetical protein